MCICQKKAAHQTDQFPGETNYVKHKIRNWLSHHGYNGKNHGYQGNNWGFLNYKRDIQNIISE